MQDFFGGYCESVVEKDKRKGRDGGGSWAWIVCFKAQIVKEEKFFSAGNVDMETKHDSYP